MLVSENKFDRTGSKYKCDRCSKQISPMERNAIYVAEGLSNLHKRWDFCPRCLKLLERGIDKYGAR